MRALSVRQPWIWATLFAGKDIENRTWPTTHRGRLALQAPGTVDRTAVDHLRHLGYPVPEQLPTGVVLGGVTVTGCVRGATSAWAEPGQWHWRLTDPEPWPQPLACPGRLGLFTLPPDLTVPAGPPPAPVGAARGAAVRTPTAASPRSGPIDPGREPALFDAAGEWA